MDLLCPAGSRIPSALDIDLDRLPSSTPPRPQRAAPDGGRPVATAFDEVVDSRVVRLRALAFTASAAALVALSAGALRLAL